MRLINVISLLVSCAVTAAYAQAPSNGVSLQIFYNNNQSINLHASDCNNRTLICVNNMLQSARAQLPVKYTISNIKYIGPALTYAPIASYNDYPASQSSCDINQVFVDAIAKQSIIDITSLHLSFDLEKSCRASVPPRKNPPATTAQVPVKRITILPIIPFDEICYLYNEHAGDRPMTLINGRNALSHADSEAFLKQYATRLSKNDLAGYYDIGMGTDQDRNKATQMYIENANAGNIEAQYILAVRYAYGIGADKNLTLAKRWLNRLLSAKLTAPKPSDYDNSGTGHVSPNIHNYGYHFALILYNMNLQITDCAKKLLTKINPK